MKPPTSSKKTAGENMANISGVDLLSIEANDVQHDAVLDYYGRRLATCSSDKTIKIFEVEGESHRLVETLKGYEAFKYPMALALTVFIGTKALCGAWHGYVPLIAYAHFCGVDKSYAGAPKIWQHPRILLIRRQSPHLA